MEDIPYKDVTTWRSSQKVQTITTNSKNYPNRGGGACQSLSAQTNRDVTGDCMKNGAYCISLIFLKTLQPLVNK